MELEAAFVYILLCADKTLYTGWTNNLNRRLAAHQAGRGAKYLSLIHIYLCIY